MLSILSRRASRLLALALLASPWLFAAPAAADNVWLVLQVEAGAAAKPDASQARQIEQLLRARGLDLIDGASAAGDFARRHSRESRRLAPEQAKKLDGALRQLADDLAAENLERAQNALDEVEALAPDVRDQLNHETPRARRRFHICLLAGHLFSKEGERNQAFEQIRKCARDFPGLQPEQTQYMPESMRSFFSRAEQELQSIRAASLHIDVENGRDLGCSARVNGIDRGPIPATVDEIRTQRVRVQVDCGNADGRIYEVALEPGDNTIRIDPELDRAIRTDSGVGLVYRDRATAANNRLLHSLRIARAVGADHLIQIWNGELHRIDVDTRKELVANNTSAALEQQLDQLLAGPGGATILQPMASDSSGSARTTSPYTALAWITAGAAVLAGGGALIAWRVREGAVDQFNDTSSGVTCYSRFDSNPPAICREHLATADSSETAIWALGFTGIGLAGLAATFFAIDARLDLRAPERAQGCGTGPGELGVECRFHF